MNLEDRIKFHLVPTWLHLFDVRRRLRCKEPEFDLLDVLVPRNRVALDVGANKGAYSWKLHRLAQAVHAFEPNPEIIPWLSRLAEVGLTVHPVALGDRDGEATLRIPLGRSGDLSKQRATLAPTEHVRRRFVERQVVVRRLDSLDLGNIGFIKVDVEGFETQVIEGARETLARCRPVMLIEIEEAHTGEPPSVLIERIETFGYACYALVGGVLTGARSIDLHSTYVFNWIFLPCDYG